MMLFKCIRASKATLSPLAGLSAPDTSATQTLEYMLTSTQCYLCPLDANSLKTAPVNITVIDASWKRKLCLCTQIDVCVICKKKKRLFKQPHGSIC